MRQVRIDNKGNYMLTPKQREYLHANVRHTLKERGWTSKRLQMSLHVSQPTFHKIIFGRYKVLKKSYMTRLCQITRMTASELTGVCDFAILKEHPMGRYIPKKPAKKSARPKSVNEVIVKGDVEELVDLFQKSKPVAIGAAEIAKAKEDVATDELGPRVSEALEELGHMTGSQIIAALAKDEKLVTKVVSGLLLIGSAVMLAEKQVSNNPETKSEIIAQYLQDQMRSIK